MEGLLLYRGITRFKILMAMSQNNRNPQKKKKRISMHAPFAPVAVHLSWP